jgi:hypothetical protein
MAQGGEQPPQAPEAPQAPQSPLQAPVNTKAVAALALQKQRAMQALAAKEFAARQKAEVAPKEAVAPSEALPAASFNDRADEIEKTIKDAQAVIGDPSSAPDAVAMAKSALRKAASAAAAQHDATKGGSKGVKKAPAAHTSPPHASVPETHEIHTKYGTRTIRADTITNHDKGAGWQNGTNKKGDVRKAVTEAGKHLSTTNPKNSTAIHAAMDSIRSKAETGDVKTASRARKMVEETLTEHNIHGADRKALLHHFETFNTKHGMQFYHSWTDKNEAAREARQRAKLSKVKERITKQANAAKKNQ